MKKLLCIALCALTLLAIAACGKEQLVQESAQPTPSTAATPGGCEPGAELEVSAPTLDDVSAIELSVPNRGENSAIVRRVFSYGEQAALVEEIKGMKITGPADGDRAAPERLYGVDLTCQRVIPNAFGHTIVLYSYSFYEGGVVCLPDGGFYEYEPSSLDLGMFETLIADRPMPEHSQEDIESAIAAAGTWVGEWDGVEPEEVWYDIDADAFWSGFASHDNFNCRILHELDFITICCTYSSPSGGTMPDLQPGETGAVVLVRFGNGGWEYRVWTAWV